MAGAASGTQTEEGWISFWPKKNRTVGQVDLAEE